MQSVEMQAVCRAHRQMDRPDPENERIFTSTIIIFYYYQQIYFNEIAVTGLCKTLVLVQTGESHSC